MCILAFLIIPGLFAPAVAQDLPFDMPMSIDGILGYDESIPKPEDVIGHRIGTRHTLPYQVEAYFKAVDAASDRVTVEAHAESYEGRNLIHAIVTSPANHARLEEIRRANLRLSDEPGSVSDSDVSEMPVVLYQGYSIHGNEASGTEAAVLYLYHLAAGQGPAIDEALDRAVILVDPMFNPDGRDRFADWANRNRGAVPVSDPQDREHREDWPGGRTNHYWFDLNRDWIASQHPESQGRLAFFHSWRPQVLTDHHEMGAGATFFFQPGIPSRNNPNTPGRTYELTAAIAEFHAAQLDRIGSQYYSEEGFDDFFLGKGSAYPDVNGAIGILFEQASSRALETESSDGPLHYAFTVRNQFAASLSTLAAGVALRERLLRHQRDFYRESADLAAASGVKAYLVGMERGRTRAQALAQLLKRHRVRVHELSRDVSTGGVAFHPGEAYVIPMAQPQYRFIKSVMERTFEYEDSLFYDVSTWTLPLAFDVDDAVYERDPRDILGGEIASVSLDGGAVVGGRATYAYLMQWDRYFAPRSVYRLLEAGVPVRVMHAPFSAVVGGQEHSFPRGTIVVPLRGRDTARGGLAPDTVHAIVRLAAERDHTIFHAVSTGLTPVGPDLGGESTSLLQRPEIGLLAGDGASSTTAGEAWHLISERFRMPVSLLDPGSLAGMDLSRYNVIIHPGGSLGDSPSEALESWVRSGGRLVLFAGALGWARGRSFIDLDTKPFDMDSLLGGLTFDQLDEGRGAHSIGGSIFAVDLDTTHPLAYGLPERLPVFRTGSEFHMAPETPGAAIGVYDETPLLSGYISDDKLSALPGSAAVVLERVGGGRVIMFMDRLSFRAYWYGSQRLLMNAIVLSNTF